MDQEWQREKGAVYSEQNSQVISHLVLDGIIAAHGGHILRHDGLLFVVGCAEAKQSWELIPVPSLGRKQRYMCGTGQLGGARLDRDVGWYGLEGVGW
jgi:hypothetical protein